MSSLRFAVIGTGFWSRYQLAAWREVGRVECVAAYNRTRSKAEAVAAEFGIPRVYDDAEEMLRREKLDFVDVITDVDTHAHFVLMAARHRVPVICQKPMAPDLPTAHRMVATCRELRVPFYVHENWRWQHPLREVKRTLDEGTIGRPFRARIDFSCSFPVFDNQPFLRDLEQFILTDIGSHILDTARFLFGEAETLYCQTHRVNATIRGEDVATVVMRMGHGVTATCNMSYASRLEEERFPQTFVLVEGQRGSVALGPDYRLSVTTEAGTDVRTCAPPHYDWADPAYDVVHASIVPCCADLLRGLEQRGIPETVADDNLGTMELVFCAYDSAAADRVVHFRTC